MNSEQAERVLNRDNYTCQYCLAQYPPEGHALHVHHRIFKSQGGLDEDENLVACCWKCHHAHGKLKNRPLYFENGTEIIDKLKQRYAGRKTALCKG
jgi:5-methylcytosine-specific restriction endonuclease McrA